MFHKFTACFALLSFKSIAINISFILDNQTMLALFISKICSSYDIEYLIDCCHEANVAIYFINNLIFD